MKLNWLRFISLGLVVSVGLACSGNEVSPTLGLPPTSAPQATPIPTLSPVVATTQTPTSTTAAGVTPTAAPVETPVLTPTPGASPAPTPAQTVTAIPTPTAKAEPTPEPTAAPTSTPTPPPLALETWVSQSGVVRARTTSTSSISLPEGAIRTYFLDGTTIAFAESSDGLDLSETVSTNIVGTGIPGDSHSFVSNPAVLLRDDGMYLLVYEANSSPPPNQKDRALFSAESEDGITFGTPVALPNSSLDQSPGGETLFQSVPDVVTLPDGSVGLYYVARGNAVASMRSDDGGKTWSQDAGYRLGEMFGRSEAAYVDPDVVVRPDGRTTMYVAYSEFESRCGGLGCQRIRTAHSDDGLDFTMAPGDLLTAPAGKLGLVDPDVYEDADGNWHMLYGEMVEGHSVDLTSAILEPGDTGYSNRTYLGSMPCQREFLALTDNIEVLGRSSLAFRTWIL